MSEVGKAQDRAGKPVYVGEGEKPGLTNEEQIFLETLYRVLPKLVSGLKMPTNSDDRPDEREIHQGLDSGEGQEGRFREACASEQYDKACQGLYDIIKMFRNIESRIRTVEGGTQLMDALVELEEVTRKYIPGDLRTTLSSFCSASGALFKAFKKLGEGLFKEHHIVPLRNLELFCWINYSNNHEEIEILPPLSKHIVDVTQGLSEVIESAIPVFLEAREKVQSVDYNNMLTAATFFSAVTTTTLQLSYAYNASTRASLGVVVNTLWFLALVFSTASSLNSLVGLTWYQKIRRSHLLPNWVKLWLEYGPAVSLAVASAAFSTGLCLFAFSSSQNTITSTLTVAFTAAHAVPLLVPLCIYSPDSLRLGRFLVLVLFKALLAFLYLLLSPYLFIVYIKDKAHERSIKKASEVRNERNIFSSSTREASPDSNSTPIGVEGNNKMDLIAHATEAFGNTEQMRGPDEKVDMLRKLERDIESQGNAGKSNIRRFILTEDQDIVPPEALRISIRGITGSNEDAAHTAKRPGKEFGHSSDTPESMEGHTAAISSTAHLTQVPGPSSSSGNPKFGRRHREHREARDGYPREAKSTAGR